MRSRGQAAQIAGLLSEDTVPLNQCEITGEPMTDRKAQQIGSSITRRPPSPPSFPAKAIEEAVAGIRHGIVQLIIQDGRIIQIDKTEKIRLV